VVDASGNVITDYHQIQSGPNQGLYALTMDVNLTATAQRVNSAQDQVSMMRTVEVALIPVFQFGVFSESDLGFFNSPDLDFNGRVHTNGDLYLGVFSGSTLNFHDKVTAYGNVIRQVLPNGLDATAYSDTGTVNLIASAGGCNSMPGGPRGPYCKPIAMNQGSVTGGPASAYNSNPDWATNTSGTYYNGWLANGNFGNTPNTGVKRLSLPFTATGAMPYEIVRRPPAGEAPTSGIGQSRLYNEAEVRVLLTDDPAELPGGAGDPQNIRLANVAPYANGVPTGAGVTTYFAEGTTNAGAGPNTTGMSNCNAAVAPADWPMAPPAPPAGYATLVPAGAPLITANTWNLLDGYLRVEYRDVNGNYQAVTQEWLQLGFARGMVPPTNGVANPINPNAILLLQMPADRNANGAIDAAYGGACSGGTPNRRPAELQTDANTGSPYTGAAAQATSVTRTNWYPINFYDAREGETRDTVQAGCTPAGIMSAVELDVRNLKKWLAGNIGANGLNVDSNTFNGYILYFSDRRGMLPSPNGTAVGPANTKTGDSGLEDSINAGSAAGTPDQALETPGGSNSPEDVNQNGRLDNFGTRNIGAGFNINTSAPLNEYGAARIPNCSTTQGTGAAGLAGRKNAVSGARHALKLVDGGGINASRALPMRPTNPPTGGFTVASENPVYIQGDYNTDNTDPQWPPDPTVAEPTHAAAGIIADTVTLLSNQWSDTLSLVNPSGATAGGRNSVTTRYRVAIAAGKTRTFPNPNYATGNLYGFGTDGGVHNFLRFLEDWTGDALYYKGSLVSLYYSTYNTGTFKCCGDAVYHPPVRNYYFDPLFSQPANLPPGTPMFRDVDNLSYRQDFTPH
jgi:hypothetical protein